MKIGSSGRRAAEKPKSRKHFCALEMFYSRNHSLGDREEAPGQTDCVF